MNSGNIYMEEGSPGSLHAIGLRATVLNKGAMEEMNVGNENETARTDQQLGRMAVAHAAKNEMVSISIGLQLLSSIPAEALSAKQLQALGHLKTSGERMTRLVDEMKSWLD